MRSSYVVDWFADFIIDSRMKMPAGSAMIVMLFTIAAIPAPPDLIRLAFALKRAPHQRRLGWGNSLYGYNGPAPARIHKVALDAAIP